MKWFGLFLFLKFQVEFHVASSGNELSLTLGYIVKDNLVPTVLPRLFYAVLGIKPKASCMPGKYSINWMAWSAPLPKVFFFFFYSCCWRPHHRSSLEKICQQRDLFQLNHRGICKSSELQCILFEWREWMSGRGISLWKQKKGQLWRQRWEDDSWDKM